MFRRVTSVKRLANQAKCFFAENTQNTQQGENNVPAYSRAEFEPFKFKHERYNLHYGYSIQELYGKRYGLKHSPQIRREIAKDNVMIIVSFVIMLSFGLLDRQYKYQEDQAWDEYHYHDMNYYRAQDPNGNGNASE